MLFVLIAYLGGVLTILSPCILPVLPFVFARSNQPFLSSGLPILIGMALTFALVATLAAVGGGWVVEANHSGRIAAILLMGVFGVTLLFPHLADRLMRPVVALGSRLSQKADSRRDRPSFGGSLLLGVATGMLLAPCAGPILGLLLTGAALKGATIGTSLLLLAYAAGAATSLAIALLIGGRVFIAMKRSLGTGEWIRRGLDVAVLASVVVIGVGLDTGISSRISYVSTNSIEQTLIDDIRTAQPATSQLVVQDNPSVMKAAPSMMMTAQAQTEQLPVEGPLPDLSGAVAWLNSQPLTAKDLRGHVVLVDFWTYSCINCLRALPYVEAWAKKYHDQGLIVIGVHAPEFAFERNIDNVKGAVKQLGMDYPVAIDNNYAIWKGFNNEYWPAHYFIDAQGRNRHHHFGEGGYAGSEHVIQQLLREAGDQTVASNTVTVRGTGVEQASDMADVGSPETYIGTERAQDFVSPGGAVQDKAHTYTAPSHVTLDQWALAGEWQVGGQNAVLIQPGGAITYRFHARDLHLVLGPATEGKQVRFHITVDGHSPGADNGVDVDAAGDGIITGQRLYQLVRQQGEVDDHTFNIRFLVAPATACSFTFG
jgi:cytochrome c biogenesis protein CcdA/thiol-disulfide isomerase/thioredoxin